MEKSNYDPDKKRYRRFHYDCKYRYDDIRPNRDTLRSASVGKENPNKSESGGHKALIGRCLLNLPRKCIFPEKTHYDCPMSISKKRKINQRDFVKFKGKWKKRSRL